MKLVRDPGSSLRRLSPKLELRTFDLYRGNDRYVEQREKTNESDGGYDVEKFDTSDPVILLVGGWSSL